MKRKNFTLLGIFILLVNFAFADNVPIEVARKVAQNYFAEKAEMKTQDVVFTETRTVNNELGDNIYYVFNLEDDKGFIIVSAEDTYTPVIGYSTERNFVFENQPANVQYWMNQYVGRIEHLRANNIEQSSKYKNLWENYTSENFVPQKSEKGVDPLTYEITWNQDGGSSQGFSGGWNYFCPEDDNGQAITGCVATAMGIIMYYWQYPITGTGISSYYSIPYGWLSVDHGETTYMWENMLPGSPTLYSALLQYHAGVSVEMSYSPEGSGTQSWKVVGAMQENFNYSTSNIYYKEDIGNEETWKNDYLKPELDAARPVYYSGTHPQDGGHAFVCDGYDDNDNFHFNFGWGGYANGFYAIDDVNGFYNYNGLIQIYEPTENYPYLDPVLNMQAEVNSENTQAYQVDLTWEAPAGTKGLTGYDVYRGDEVLATLGTDELTYSDIQTDINTLTPDYYGVRALYSNGDALCASQFVNTAFDVTFNFIDPETGNNVTGVNITFNDEDAYSSFFYFVEFSAVPFGWMYSYNVSHPNYDDVSGVIPVVNGDATYTIALGEGLVGIEEDVTEKISLYPNPTTGILNIEGVAGNSIVVTDITGKIVYQNEFSNTIDLSNQPAGIYNISILTNEGVVNQKVVLK